MLLAGAGATAELLQPWVHLDICCIAIFGTSYYITFLSDNIQPPDASMALASLAGASPPPSTSAAPPTGPALMQVMMPVGWGVLCVTAIAAGLTVAPFYFQKGGPTACACGEREGV
jgi:hypothetical protein